MTSFTTAVVAQRVSQRLLPSAVFVLGLALRVTSSFAAVTPPAGGETPTVLPDYQVSESAILPDVEKWRFARVGNYEILSQTSDAATRDLAQKLALIPTVVRAILHLGPTEYVRPTLVIFCDTAASFGGFVPPQVRAELDLTWVDRLFFPSVQGPHERVIVLHSTSREAFASLTDDLTREYVKTVLRARDASTPDWFITGISEVVADAVCVLKNDAVEVEYARLNFPHSDGFDLSNAMGSGAEQHGRDFQDMLMDGLAGNAMRPSVYDRLTISPANFEIVRGSYANQTGDAQSSAYSKIRLSFNEYFVQRPRFPAFDRVLAHDPTLNPDDYRMMCWAFVYYCAFDPRGPKAEMVKLLELTRAKPGASQAELFQKAFHLTPEAMGAKVTGQLGMMSAGITTRAPYHLPEIGIDDAGVGLIARFKAEAFVAGSHRAEAVQELERGQNYFRTGDSSAKVLERARLQLALALARPEGAAGKLSTLQTVQILDSLFAVRAREPAPLELYEAIAETWLHSEAQPKVGHLGVLIEGANRFGAKNSGYLYKVASLHLDHGFKPEAEALIAAGLRFPKEEVGERFVELSAKLKAR